MWIISGECGGDGDSLVCSARIFCCWVFGVEDLVDALDDFIEGVAVDAVVLFEVDFRDDGEVVEVLDHADVSNEDGVDGHLAELVEWRRLASREEV